MNGDAVNREARLEALDSGLAPVTAGWVVVNVRDAAWLVNDAFGARCVFESDARMLRDRPDLVAQRFPDVGVTLAVVVPGRPTGLYHAESVQEGFLVLAGECLLVIEDEERQLRAWDFVHCPPNTKHIFVGTGDEPCVLLMVGARTEGRTIVYPSSEAARRHGAAVERETTSPQQAYAALPHWRPGRPEWTGLPWA